MSKFKKFGLFLAAISCFLLALVKLGMGIYHQTSFKNGLVVITTGIYGLVIAFARFIYAMKVDTDERDQIYVYRNMAFLLMIVAISFLISNILAFDDPITDYGIWLDIAISIVLITLFVFSIKGAFKIREKNVITKSIKLVSFTSALLNLVFIEHLFEYQLNSLFRFEIFREFKMYFIISIVGIILLISLYLLISSLVKVHRFRKDRGMI